MLYNAYKAFEYSVLTMPDFNSPIKVYTDISLESVGAVLLQDKEGLERVIVYASQSLSHRKALVHI